MSVNRGVRGKFLIIILAAIILIFISMTSVIIFDVRRSYYHQHQELIETLKDQQREEGKLLNELILHKGQAIANLLTKTASGLIVGFDFDTLDQLAKDTIQDPDIAFINFFDNEGKRIASKGKFSKDLTLINKKIFFENEKVGKVQIGLKHDLIRKKMSDISKGIEKISKEKELRAKKDLSSLITLISTIALIGLSILCGIIYVMVSKIIVNPLIKIISQLKESSSQVASASSQVSSASQHLAEGASEQASSLEETSASLEELSSMTRQNADNASEAKAARNEAYKSLMAASRAMKETIEAMGRIRSSGEETAKIIKTIDEIAFQTNLLALNAAVEAARAGEAGAGFAVVADEVRNLAMRSAEAAKSTQDLIEKTVDDISKGSELLEKTNGAFEETVKNNKQVGGLIDEIAVASEEQAKGIEQINKAVSEMDKVVQQTASNAQQSASASGQLHAQAEEMRKVVDELVRLVEGNSIKEGSARVEPVEERGVGGVREDKKIIKFLPIKRDKEGREPKVIRA